MKFLGINVKSRFFLAPMAGVTNLPFRLLCKKHGAGLVFTEQVSARQVLVCERKEIEAMKTCREEKPCAVQLFGSQAEEFAKAAKLCRDFEIININCGCPQHDVTRAGAGAALLKEPEKIAEIIRAVKAEVKKPVTVKIRLGWEKDDSLEIAKAVEKAGADALIIHGRTAEQRYKGKADWKAIGRVVKGVSIPVVANGGIISAGSAEECLKVSGAEFGMVGTAALSNPFIFREIEEHFKGWEWQASDEEKLGLFKEYRKLCGKQGIVSLADLRQKAIFFTKGIRGSRKMRERLSGAKNFEEIDNAVSFCMHK